MREKSEANEDGRLTLSLTATDHPFKAALQRFSFGYKLMKAKGRRKKEGRGEDRRWTAISD